MLFLSFNLALMLFGLLIVADAHQQYPASVMLNGGRVGFVLNLLYRCPYTFIPFKFYHEGWAVISVLGFGNEDKIRNPFAGGEFAYGFKIVLHRTQICDGKYTAEGIFVIILNR